MTRPTITHHGAERLREELARLKKTERPKVIAAIAEARAHGDLRENAEYHAAREQQGFIEGRIRHLEAELSSARVIDTTKVNHGGKVVFGATVTLYDDDGERHTTYQIVGDIEADISANRIAVSSPIARALIGRTEGDEVTVNAPGGEKYYEIIKVEYL